MRNVVGALVDVRCVSYVLGDGHDAVRRRDMGHGTLDIGHWMPT